jgi:hypothetical protein
MLSKASEKQAKESSKMNAQIALQNSPYRANGSHRSVCSHGTRRYIFRTGKRKFLKKKSSPLLEAESQHFKQRKTASCHSIHGKTTKNQRCKHSEKPRSLYFLPSLSLPPQSSKGKQSLLSPFHPSVNQVYRNKDLVNRVNTILEQNLSELCERRLLLTIRQLHCRINSSSLKLEIRDWNKLSYSVLSFLLTCALYEVTYVKVHLHVLDISFHHVSIHHSPDLPNSSQISSLEGR